jgi:hypothetical protein
MQTRQLIVFVALSLLAAVVVIAAVTGYQRSHSPEVKIDTPAARVDTDNATGKTSIDAPYVHIEKDKNGTHVEAPGVKVDVPKSPSE